jgi:hypothetical protein
MAVREHELKVWPRYYAKVESGEKPWEMRLNDRDFQEGDRLRLREFDPNGGGYSGKELRRGVGFVLRGPAFGIEPGYCCFTVTP